MQVSSDPKYDKDIVNLGYLNKVLENKEKETDNKIDKLNKNYGSEPAPPYEQGDTCTIGKKIYKCIKSRDIGSFNISDWQLIVDGEELQNFINNIYTLDKIDITDQLDRKIETYIQEEDPSLNWTTDIEKEKHKGDYWRKKTNDSYREYCYTKYNTNPISYGWAETDVPPSVYDLIDGKKAIYTSKPNSYNKDDMWIIEDSILDEELPDGVKRGDWVFAIENSNVYDRTHWLKRDENVDIEYIEKNYYQITEIDNKFSEISRNTNSKIEQAKDAISLSISQTYTTKEETNSIINKVSNVEDSVGSITETITEQGEALTQLSVSTGEIRQVVSETVQKQSEVEVDLDNANDNIKNLENRLNNYTTTEEMSNIINQTIHETTNLISQTGGSNLLKNTQFYQNADEWKKSENADFDVITDSIEVEHNTTSKSELLLKNGTLSQMFSMIIDKEYTIAFKYKKEALNNRISRIRLYKTDSDYEDIFEASEATENRIEFSYTFTASVSSARLEIYTDNDEFSISDLIVQAGTSTEWSPNALETRGFGHKLSGADLELYDLGNSQEKAILDYNNLTFYKEENLRAEYGASNMSVDNATVNQSANLCGLTFTKIDDNNVIMN